MFGDCQIVSLAIDVGNAIADFLKAQDVKNDKPS
jgi:hypothetical protein